MKRNNLIGVTLFVIALGSGCGGQGGSNGQPGPNEPIGPNGQNGSGGPSQRQTPSQSNGGVSTKPVCVDDTNCEGTPYMEPLHVGNGTRKPINLTPKETESLKNSLVATRVAEPADGTHIHADVANGQLVFSPEEKQNTAHITGSEPQISMIQNGHATSSIPVKVVATPAAAKLLQERAASRPN
jgi:hypothetical protein